MKRLIATIIMLLIICALTILNIPKEPTLTTSIGTKNNTTIEIEVKEESEDSSV